MTNIRDYIKHHILLFDGGMGTYFSTRNQSVEAAASWQISASRS